MASVRLTNELKANITDAIRADFRGVREGYEIPDEVDEKVNAYARARLAKAVEERESATSAVLSVVEKEITARGGEVTDKIHRDLTESICAYVGSWDQFGVKAVDPESEDGNTILIFRAMRPYSNLTPDNRKVLAWSTVLADDCTTDQELVDEILPSFLQLRALDKARQLAIEYAKNMFVGCNTLAQLVRKWPDAMRYVPESKLELMRDKTSHKIKEKVEASPVAIMNIDEALKSISLQAEAVKALKQ